MAASVTERDEWQLALSARHRRDERTGVPRSRAIAVGVSICLAFGVVAGRLVQLALKAEPLDSVSIAMMATPAESYARPDVVDRNGRLLASDVIAPSLYADPALIQDADDVVERLATIFPDLDGVELRRDLTDPARRFVWVRRGLSPRTAQAVHDLGLPGLRFRDELRRVYPDGRLAGQILGQVDIDNRGLAGIERHIDEAIGVEAVHGATLSARAPVRLSLDLGVQHAVENELDTAMKRYGAKGAAGLVMEANTGEVVAFISLPSADPTIAAERADPVRADKLAGGTFELGSVLKTVTVAMAFESGKSLHALVDTTQPLSAGRYTIRDLHPLGRPMTIAEIFIHSSNVGAGLLALEAGPERQKAFLDKLGLLQPLKTEIGHTAVPLVPAAFGRTEQITVSYGHGLAVAPLQFAAATAALVNGGRKVVPRFIVGDAAEPGERLVTAATSAKVRELMRLNVTNEAGTGRRADVPGYRVGGKTGTAEMPSRRGYQEKSVITSFIAAFPMEAPKYVTLVMLFEPKGTTETDDRITAGVNAAPTAGRIIERVAPLLGVPAATGTDQPVR